MALTRARVVFGDAEICQNAMDCIQGVLASSTEPERIRSEVAAMRSRIAAEKKTGSVWEIKTVAGGLIDVEFIAQYLQLVHGGRCPQALDTNTLTTLTKMEAQGLLAPDEGSLLIRACRLYQCLTEVLRLAVDGAFEPETAPGRLKSVLANVGEMPDFATLEAYLAETQANVRAVFEDMIGPIERLEDPPARLAG